MHSALTDEGHSDAVEDIAVGEDTDIEIGGEDAVEAGNLLISKEGVGHPNFAGICHGQVPDFT